MPLPCFENCLKSKCSHFFTCEEHWSAEELEEMKPIVVDEKLTEKVPEMKRCAFGKMMVVMLAGLMLLGGCAGQIVQVEFAQDSFDTSTNALGFKADGSSLTTATEQGSNGQVTQTTTTSTPTEVK